ncbi:MAG: undecaprenyl-diphosphate phosphatase [Opitutales bacterium]|nr:undecaprenyl-diphosphate phosphatase [Opitutales bacterium]MCH8541076.1 undecaprenyl-diphosphate phosphatase [Opitutales bacterium]
MTIFEAILLGAVQGLFMFLPVSSTAHLVVVQHLLIQSGSELPPPESSEMLLFDLVVHVGTLVSIAVVFRQSLTRFVSRVAQDGMDLLRGKVGERLFLRLFFLGLLSTLVTGIVGLTFKGLFESVFAAPIVLGFTFTLTGCLLWWTDKLSPRQIGLRQIGVKVALVMGLAQGAALMPGLSRSGMTIVFALLMGLKRRWAAEYSFYVAFPTIIAASMVQSLLVMREAGLDGFDFLPLLVGFIVAALVGTLALKLVVTLLRRAQLKYFAFYLWFLAIAVMFGFLDRIG